jgi:hypothetical protein
MLKNILKHILLLSAFAGIGAAQLQSERYFDNTGGLVDRYSPIIVPSKSASAIQNIQFDTRGQLLKRGGYTLNNTTDLTRSTVTGGGYLQSTTGTSFLAVIVGTNVYTTGNTFGGTYTNVIGTITLTNAGTNLAQYTSFRDFGVFCNESDRPIRVKSSTAFALMEASTGAKTCESFFNYLLLGNTSEGGTTYGSRLRWSDLGDLQSWPANNYIDIEPDDGDSIVAVKRYQSNLYVFKKHSIHEVIITGSSGAEAFIVRPVARGIGAWAKNSVKAIEDRGLVFLAADGVYLFDGNSFDFISDQIQREINGLNRSRFQYSVGEVYPGKHQYWLATSYGTESANKTILVWDYIQQAWTVYSGITANALMQTEDSNGNVLLFSGDNNGNVYKQDVGTSDNPGGTSTAISSYYATPELTLGSPDIDKTFKYLYVYTNITSTTSITVDRAYDFSDSYQDSSSLSVGESGSVWNTGVWNTDIWPGQSTQVKRIELNRSHAKSIRLRFSDNSSTNLGVLGWSVVYSLEDFRGD